MASVFMVFIPSRSVGGAAWSGRSGQKIAGLPTEPDSLTGSRRTSKYALARRVERAKELLQAGVDLSLAGVALRAGFSDQSQSCRHFKRLVGSCCGGL